MFAGTGSFVSSHKTEGPSTSVTFLGIVVNLVQFQLRLPLEKVIRLRGLVGDWCHKCSCTGKELESFIGHLAHATTVNCSGWIFLWNLFDLLSLVSRLYHYVRLIAPVMTGLQWWLQFFQVWNGTSFLPPCHPSHHVYSDASKNYGCGAFDVSFRLVQGEVAQSLGDVIHRPKEIFADCHCGGYQWQGCHVCFHSDNMAVVSVLVKRATKDARMNHLLRTLFFYTAIYKFHFLSEHIPGIRNTAANALSRNITSFSCIFPQVVPVEVPAVELNVVVEAHPDWTAQAFFVQGLSPHTGSAYRSGIRRYVAFCTRLSICSYLSSLRFLQILAGGPDPGLGAFLQLHYVV